MPGGSDQYRSSSWSSFFVCESFAFSYPLHPPSDDDDEPEEEEDTKTQNSRKRKRTTKKKTGIDHCPPTCFTLCEEEIKQFIHCLIGVKFPNGYAWKIRRYLDEAKQRFSGMKSHDCAVLMTQILPMAMRGIMDEHVRKTLFGLATFLTSSLGSRFALHNS